MKLTTGEHSSYQPIEVEEKHPLKQGLKHRVRFDDVVLLGVEEKHPLKQGLKQVKRRRDIQNYLG